MRVVAVPFLWLSLVLAAAMAAMRLAYPDILPSLALSLAMTALAILWLVATVLALRSGRQGLWSLLGVPVALISGLPIAFVVVSCELFPGCADFRGWGG